MPALELEALSSRSRQFLTKHLNNLYKLSLKPYFDPRSLDLDVTLLALEVDRILDYRERQIEVEMTDAEIEKQEKMQELRESEEKEMLDTESIDMTPSKLGLTGHSSGGKELSLLTLSRSEDVEEDNMDKDPQEEEEGEDNEMPGGRRHKCDVGPLFELWQPLRRCEVVLHVLAEDELADPFNTPVELADFPDYMRYVQTPMDLSTVRSRLDKGKYKEPDSFRRDVRLVWSNCKRYNQVSSTHSFQTLLLTNTLTSYYLKAGSPIWKLAHAFAEAFEKTMEDWVYAFKDSKLSWNHSKAKPWDLDGTGEFKSVVRHENYDKPVKIVNIREYLVKWSGLSYKDSTWESEADVKGQRLDAGNMIASFHGEVDSVPTEQLLSVDEMNIELSLAKNLIFPAINEADAMAEAEVQLQMQVRNTALSFFHIVPTFLT